jgi:DNA-binding SARP family transcriptional activator
MRPPALRARLLGTVDLQLDGRPLPPLDSARAESLLACLLLHRDAPQPRQRLALLLWPGSTEGQAQTNLRKVLHNLILGRATAPAATPRARQDGDRTTVAPPRAARPAG